MAWKTSARIKSPKGTRRDLWVGFKPNGIGETKPNHYKEVLKTIWDNRDNLPYAWRILNRGVCDGCALGVAGFHDWTLSGVHLCTTRLNLLRVNTMGALDDARLADVAPLRRLKGKELRDLGRLAHPMVRRRGEPGFTRVTLGRGPRPARRPDPRHDPGAPRGVPDRPGHHQRDLLRRAEVHPVPRQQQHRQRGTGLPCAVDDDAEEDDRRRRDDVLLHRRHRQRPHRVVRRQRRQRAAGVHEVPLPGAQARREGRGGEPVAGARAGPLLGAQQRRERDVRYAHDRRVLRGAHRR